MHLPAHKTKIVATIGPASRSPEMIERLIRAGLSVARLNFSHGTFDDHARAIDVLRRAAARLARRVAIMADLPGPKMRLGTIEPGPVTLLAGADFVLTTRTIAGNAREASMSFERLPEVVHSGDRLFLNDGLVQLVVEKVDGPDVHCTVAVGGEISSRKGLNIPNIPLGVSAFTARDRECLDFAIRQGVDAVSQSFVESAEDIETARQAARDFGGHPFLIAKIERSAALENFDAILAAADGIMVARGDLGIEVPVEEMAILQKQLIAKANVAGKPAITATQMLESMTSSRLPTRAEATDVANAILDGTDCVMLSAESAAGQFPEESVAMLARIAAVTEAHRPAGFLDHQLAKVDQSYADPDVLARLVGSALKAVSVDAVVTPALSGSTARGVSRFRSAAWILATGSEGQTMQDLVFSYGVHPLDLPAGADWKTFAREALLGLEPRPRKALFVSGPSPAAPDASRSIELVEW